MKPPVIPGVKVGLTHALPEAGMQHPVRVHAMRVDHEASTRIVIDVPDEYLAAMPPECAGSSHLHLALIYLMKALDA